MCQFDGGKWGQGRIQTTQCRVQHTNHQAIALNNQLIFPLRFTHHRFPNPSLQESECDNILLFAFNREAWTFFFVQVYFSNDTASQTTVSTGPMKMFRSEHETMNVCQRNVASFGHVECRFDKINDIYQGLGSLVSLRLQKDGGAKRKQIWTNLSHWNTGGSSYHCEEFLFLNLCLNVQLVKRDIVTPIIYYYIMTQVSLRETWLSVWRCYVWGKR